MRAWIPDICAGCLPHGHLARGAGGGSRATTLRQAQENQWLPLRLGIRVLEVGGDGGAYEAAQGAQAEV